MNRVINVHADDYGLGKEISNNIIECINYGIVNSISIICNTKDFIDSIKIIKKSTNGVRTSLHINLVEGSPLTDPSKVYMIINKDGEFRYSFITIWLKYILSTRYTRTKLREQIKTEIKSQIERYCNYYSDSKVLRLDSHMHLHMIPFIFDIYLELSKDYDIKFIRIPYELKYFNSRKLINFISPNVIKNCLLNYLSKHNAPKLKKHKIKRNDYFIGVLASGNMDAEDVRLALSKINKYTRPKSVEILFHPGGVEYKKSVDWTKNDMFRTYYSSDYRQKEKNILKSGELKKIVNYYETLFSNR